MPCLAPLLEWVEVRPQATPLIELVLHLSARHPSDAPVQGSIPADCCMFDGESRPKFHLPALFPGLPPLPGRLRTLHSLCTTYHPALLPFEPNSVPSLATAAEPLVFTNLSLIPPFA